MHKSKHTLNINHNTHKAQIKPYIKPLIKTYIDTLIKWYINQISLSTFVSLTDVVFILCKSVASLIAAFKILVHIFKVRPSSMPCRFTCGKFWKILSCFGSGPKGVNPSLSGGPIQAHSTCILIPKSCAPFTANFLVICWRTYIKGKNHQSLY